MQKIGFCDKYSLTQGVLNGTKEMTRRLEKALERAVAEYNQLFGLPFSVSSQEWDAKKKCLIIWTPKSYIELKTRYKLGETVAVAQSYKDAGYNGKEKYGYCYDENEEAVDVLFEEVKGWNNKLFVKPSKMPHQIQITGVRIERLQDITDEDCVKEGITKGDDEGSPVYWIALPTDIGWKEYRKRAKEVSRHIRGGLYSYFYNNPREAFAALINRPGVGRKGLWEENPWVVVYEFKLIK